MLRDLTWKQYQEVLLFFKVEQNVKERKQQMMDEIMNEEFLKTKQRQQEQS